MNKRRKAAFMKRTSEKLPAWAKGALWTIGVMNLVVFVFIVLPWLIRVIWSVQVLALGH